MKGQLTWNRKAPPSFSSRSRDDLSKERREGTVDSHSCLTRGSQMAPSETPFNADAGTIHHEKEAKNDEKEAKSDEKVASS